MLSEIHLCLSEDYIHVFVALPCAVTLMSDCLPVRAVTPWLVFLIEMLARINFAIMPPHLLTIEVTN